MNRRSALVALACLFVGHQAGAAPTYAPLFHIGRSTNANLVQYDAIVVGPGRLHATTPVVASWVMLAEDGRREGLNMLDRRAYGFQVRPENGGSWLLYLKATPDRAIRVVHWNGRWVAQTLIRGRSAVLQRAFVSVDERGILPIVRWIDLYGVDMANGEALTERLHP